MWLCVVAIVLLSLWKGQSAGGLILSWGLGAVFIGLIFSLFIVVAECGYRRQARDELPSEHDDQ